LLLLLLLFLPLLLLFLLAFLYGLRQPRQQRGVCSYSAILALLGALPEPGLELCSAPVLPSACRVL